MAGMAGYRVGVRYGHSGQGPSLTATVARQFVHRRGVGRMIGHKCGSWDFARRNEFVPLRADFLLTFFSF